VAAALLGASAVVESIARDAGGSASAQFVLFTCLLGLATTLPLAVPRPAVTAAVIVTAGGASLAVVHTVTVASAVAVLIAAHRLGRRGAPPVAVVLGLPFLVLAMIEPFGYARFVAVVLAALAPASALAGVAGRIASDATENQAARVALAGTLFAHTARGERARIARELHDVVAHHVSMIAVQAETARLTTPGMPVAGAQRLMAIGDTARAALTEMRRLLGVLREDAEADTPERAPQPGLAQLNELLDGARDASGTGTRLILRGTPVTLDPGVELAAYRIVQEALTNARRHAPGAAVDVELHYTDARLRLMIRDNGPGPRTGSDGGGHRLGGHGLLGMSERATAVGGTLCAGAASSGGFLIKASLPAKEELG
jgi:signal transduction histidine kinase